MGAALRFAKKAEIGKYLMRVSALEGHRVWAPFYDSDNPVLALERRSMMRFLGPAAHSRVLDVACGSGHWLRHFENAGAEVFGVDFCPEMIAGTTLVASLRGRVALGDVCHLPFRAGTADLVFCSMALGYFPDLATSFREFARVAVSGASIALSDLHPDAIAAGWTRSFTVGEAHYEIEHYGRALEEIDAAALAVGLQVVRTANAHIGEPEYSFFQSRGKAERFAKVSETPALFLRLWRKPC
jgi:ubiquinone/menaquinone biosynthesis C-methylase UbiE